MAKLTEIERWEEEIYRIEENDPVHGGENGITNKPTKQLANRTLFLRKQLQLAGQKLVPKKLTSTTRNLADETGHTHEIERGDTTKAGLMQLTNDTGLESENLGLSAKGGKAIAQSVAQLQQRLNDGLNQKVNKTDISDAVNSESRTTVASSKAVKTAYDKAVEAKDKAEAIAVGAQNLLLKSSVPYSGSDYSKSYELAEAPKVGEEIVVTLWGELGAQRTGIGVYNTVGFTEIAKLTKLRDGVYQGKGVWRKPMRDGQEVTPNDTHLRVYFYPSTATDNNRIERIQLERGNIGTDWKPNPEDIKSDVQKETRTKFITVRGGSQAVTFDAAKRSDWFREIQIPESGGWGYYIQAFHNSGTQHVYSNFPLNGRFYFTAEVFHSAGFSHVRITYPSQNRVFETAVNFNQEDLMLDWREVVLVKDGVHRGDFKVKGSVVSDYRLRVERNDARYPPYIQTVDANLDISRGISANKVIGEYFCYVKDGENDRAKSVHRTGILTDGNVFTELGQWNAENRYQVPWKSFSKTNNTAIGKTTDNERDCLQVNGTIQATAPADSANNDQVPTTAWVRNYGIAQSGNQVLNGQLNVGRANEWKKLGFPSGNGEFVWETHPQASQETPNSVRFNVKFLENGQDTRYVSFPEFGTANETVAYRSWVDIKATSLANAKVSKAGDTMTGNLELKVGDYSWINQYNTAGKQARIETVPDNSEHYYKVSQRSNNGQTEYHSAYFPKRGMGQVVAYESLITNGFTRSWYPTHYAGTEVYKSSLWGLMIVVMNTNEANKEFVLPEAYTGHAVVLANDRGDGRISLSGSRFLGGNKIRLTGRSDTHCHVLVVGSIG